eukprot:TRINITY_DN1712_c0_g1_i1.p1 TRINITY_DN1712_c0_g1~~TRINITY_DN1712_c0_g1_i1.p1  ORF type:complete len:690 (+),score=161.96 TRINITY_DN1712_c0_g1_i1:130-2199(+)
MLNRASPSFSSTDDVHRQLEAKEKEIRRLALIAEKDHRDAMYLMGTITKMSRSLSDLRDDFQVEYPPSPLSISDPSSMVPSPSITIPQPSIQRGERHGIGDGPGPSLPSPSMSSAESFSSSLGSFGSPSFRDSTGESSPSGHPSPDQPHSQPSQVHSPSTQCCFSSPTSPVHVKRGSPCIASNVTSALILDLDAKDKELARVQERATSEAARAKSLALQVNELEMSLKEETSRCASRVALAQSRLDDQEHEIQRQAKVAERLRRDTISGWNEITKLRRFLEALITARKEHAAKTQHNGATPARHRSSDASIHYNEAASQGLHRIPSNEAHTHRNSTSSTHNSNNNNNADARSSRTLGVSQSGNDLPQILSNLNAWSRRVQTDPGLVSSPPTYSYREEAPSIMASPRTALRHKLDQLLQQQVAKEAELARVMAIATYEFDSASMVRNKADEVRGVLISELASVDHVIEERLNQIQSKTEAIDHVTERAARQHSRWMSVAKKIGQTKTHVPPLSAEIRSLPTKPDADSRRRHSSHVSRKSKQPRHHDEPSTLSMSATDCAPVPDLDDICDQRFLGDLSDYVLGDQSQPNKIACLETLQALKRPYPSAIPLDTPQVSCSMYISKLQVIALLEREEAKVDMELEHVKKVAEAEACRCAIVKEKLREVEDEAQLGRDDERPPEELRRATRTIPL